MIFVCPNGGDGILKSKAKLLSYVSSSHVTDTLYFMLILVDTIDHLNRLKAYVVIYLSIDYH